VSKSKTKPTNRPTRLYFIDRGPQPENHKAPYHRFLICTDKKTAEWEVGHSSRPGWLWVRDEVGDREHGGSGWLILRWNGLVIDYGPVVHSFLLPDNKRTGFSHPGQNEAPWWMLKEAVWWSTKMIPWWLVDIGVKPPEDSFSLDLISKKYEQGQF
jgi:hypothetical protein